MNDLHYAILIVIILVAVAAWIADLIYSNEPHLSVPVGVVGLGLWPMGVYSWGVAVVVVEIAVLLRVLSLCVEQDIDTPWG